MKQQFPAKNMMSRFASFKNACFAMSVCLIMMGAISMVSIILLVGVMISLLVLPLLLTKEGRKRTMVVSNA